MAAIHTEASIEAAVPRLAYAIIEGIASFHGASIQILPEGAGRCRLAWIADLLPDTLAARFEAKIQQGTALMKRTIESAAAGN